MKIKIEWDKRELAALKPGRMRAALARAVRKAGSTALRDMRSEASKRVRERKRIKARYVREALVPRRPRGSVIDDAVWGVDVKGGRVPLTAYPVRQTKKGVSVEINRGKRTRIKSAFLATMTKGGKGGGGVGYRGVFIRRGTERLPIRELTGSRPVDALLHRGEADAVQERGRRAFIATFDRVLPLELDKGKEN